MIRERASISRYMYSGCLVIFKHFIPVVLTVLLKNVHWTISILTYHHHNQNHNQNDNHHHHHQHHHREFIFLLMHKLKTMKSCVRLKQWSDIQRRHYMQWVICFMFWPLWPKLEDLKQRLARVWIFFVRHCVNTVMAGKSNPLLPVHSDSTEAHSLCYYVQRFVSSLKMRPSRCAETSVTQHPVTREYMPQEQRIGYRIWGIIMSIAYLCLKSFLL